MNEPDNSSANSAGAESRLATGDPGLPPAPDSSDARAARPGELTAASNVEPNSDPSPAPHSLPNLTQPGESPSWQTPPVQTPLGQTPLGQTPLGQTPLGQTMVPPEPEIRAEVHAEAQPQTHPETWAQREDGQVGGPYAEQVISPAPSPDPSTVFFPDRPPERRVLSANMWPDFATPLRAVDLLYLLAFYFVAGAVLTVMVAGATMLGFHLSAATLQKSVADRSMVMIVSQGLLSVATVIFLYAVIRSRSAIPFWRALGWRPFRLASRDAGSQLSVILKYVVGGFGLALTVGWLSRFFNQDTQLPMEDLFRSRQTVLLLMGLGILVAPVVEETVFRGCIFPVLSRKLGVPAGVILTGVLFGVAHAQQLWGGWGEIALLICVGIVLTYVRARAGTVAASYLVHVSYNTILFTGFYFATHGLRYFPPS
jgi:membrane protease YdiL (CAAX protease family)